MKKIIVLFIFTLAFSCRLFSQDPNFQVIHITAVNGLPSGIIRDVSWDKDGFLWISTLKGLARFDGVWLRSFTKYTYPELRNDLVSAFSTDEQGRTIFCDDHAYIYALTSNHITLIDKGRYDSTRGVNHLALFLPPKFRDMFLYKWNDKFFSFNEAVLTDPDHFLLADNKTLLQYDASGASSVIRTFPEPVKLFRMGNSIYLYEKGTAVYEIQVSNSGKPVIFYKINIPFDLKGAEIFWRNGMNEAILTQNRNAFQLSLDKGVFKKELICTNLPDAIMLTNIKHNPGTGITAVATDGDGVYIYRRKILTSHILRSNDIFTTSTNSFYSQVEAEPGVLWLNQNAKLNLNDGKFSKGTVYGFESSFRLKDSMLLFTFPDSNVLSYSLADRTLRTRFKALKGQSSSFVFTENRLFHAGDVEIVEMNAEKDSSFFRFPVSKGFIDAAARDVIEFSPGYLVFCGREGVFGFDIHYRKLDTLMLHPGQTILRSVTRYKDYLLVADYSQGIWMIRNKEARLLPLDKREYLRNVHNIFIDRHAFAWIACNAGIFRTSGKILEDHYNNIAKGSASLDCEYYGKEDGFDIPELNGSRQGALIQLKNGMLSYAGIGGMVTADIDRAGAVLSRPAIVVDQLFVNNADMTDSMLRDNIKFSSNTRSLKFYFSIPVWGNRENQVVEYQLKGYSDEWEDVDFARQNYIELRNLRTGKYVLHIRTSPLLDRTHPAEYQFPFEIGIAWYKTDLFYGLLAAFILTVGIIIFRLRVQYLKKRNRILSAKIDSQVEALNEQKTKLEDQIVEMEAYQQKLEKDYALKNRLISIIGHDIITPLRFMNRAGKILVTQKDKIDQKSFDETLQTILDTGTGLQDMAANMLNWIKHHQETMRFMLSDFDIREVATNLIGNVKPMADFKQLSIVNDIPEGIAVHQYADPVKTILVQLLTNSIKYSEKGSISIEARLKEQQVFLYVTDEGVGMPPDMIAHLVDSDKMSDFTSVHENKGHGFGFLIIKDMIKIIHGTISIESTPNHGTKVTLQFPATIYEERKEPGTASE